jgi:hypothetical protein
MATSRPVTRVWVIGVAAMVLALAAVAALLAAGSSGQGVGSGDTGHPRTRHAVTFSWLRPAAAPRGWLQTTTATSHATLFYPSAWRPIPGDTGTVTVSLRDHAGLYAGYLNVTPRQGAEQLHGWAAFRTNRNREDGDGHVRQVAAAEGLRFRNALGSCVIDDYLSKVGSHPYREIACIVRGHGHTNVFIGAALRRDWQVLGGILEGAASSLLQR